ncbi:MAG: polyprenyl synthetase family protein [Candidatus Thorarchaeota archaeon]
MKQNGGATHLPDKVEMKGTPSPVQDEDREELTLIEMGDLQEKAAERMKYYLRKSFGQRSIVHKLIKDYPTRPGKGIRPSFCIAACGAVGGDIENALNTAVTIELLHNSFLIKDDIVDGSDYRRGDVTLNKMYGFELAINAGDALKVLSLLPLVDNMQVIGVRKALQIILEIQHMASRSVEGQIIELDWIKRNIVPTRYQDYYRMCTLKTCWYTCITPARTGIIVGLKNASEQQLSAITEFGRTLGIGFQIRDDVLNLTSTFDLYGKEINGDIREGKRTLMLIHLINSVTPREKEKIVRILEKPRDKKTNDEVDYIRGLMNRHGSIDEAMRVSRRFALKARRVLKNDCTWMTESNWKDFFLRMTNYLIDRNK